MSDEYLTDLYLVFKTINLTMFHKSTKIADMNLFDPINESNLYLHTLLFI